MQSRTPSARANTATGERVASLPIQSTVVALGATVMAAPSTARPIA
jgi:hypothetical protein